MPTRALAIPPQLKSLHSEDARLQAIRDTLITKARRNVTLKKSAVLAFMTAQFGVLGTHTERAISSVCVHVFGEAVLRQDKGALGLGFEVVHRLGRLRRQSPLVRSQSCRDSSGWSCGSKRSQLGPRPTNLSSLCCGKSPNLMGCKDTQREEIATALNYPRSSGEVRGGEHRDNKRLLWTQIADALKHRYCILRHHSPSSSYEDDEGAKTHAAATSCSRMLSCLRPRLLQQISSR